MTLTLIWMIVLSATGVFSATPAPTVNPPAPTSVILAWVFGILLCLCVVLLVITCIWGCRNGSIDVDSKVDGGFSPVESKVDKRYRFKGV